MKISQIAIALASCVAAGVSTASAGLSVISSADAFVSSNTAQNAAGTATIANSNYGGAGALGVAAAGLPKGEFDSFVKFDLSSIKSGYDTLYGAGQWTVTGVTLKLTTTPPNNAIFNGFGTGNTAGFFGISLLQNNSWVEGTGVPNAAGTDINSAHLNFANHTNYLTPGSDQSLGAFSFPGGTTGTNTYSLGLASNFVSDILSGSLASLDFTPGDSSIAYLFNSRTSTGNEPTLTVSAIAAVPEPSCLVFGIAAASCVAMRRRRRA